MTADGVHVPRKGDLVWLDLGEDVTGEVGKRRPVLVLSEIAFNREREVCIVAPVSTSMRGYSTEVDLPLNLAVQGAVMSEHVRTVNWRVRNARPIGRVPARVVEAVLNRLCVILGIEQK